jgi:dTDP-4-dehydrorhamnose 3,5-epimerase
MRVETLSIPDVKLVFSRRFADDRGFFSETFNLRAFAETGVNAGFVQDNHSFSEKAGTVRGLHYQSPPHAQGKLVRVITGAVLDVVVDARVGSPSFGQHVSAELTAENGAQIWVPEGFLHGFITLTDAVHLVYKVTDYYDADCDGAVAWNDPDLGIDWQPPAGEATLSQKDAAAQSWSDFQSPFVFKA